MSPSLWERILLHMHIIIRDELLASSISAGFDVRKNLTCAAPTPTPTTTLPFSFSSHPRVSLHSELATVSLCFWFGDQSHLVHEHQKPLTTTLRSKVDI